MLTLRLSFTLLYETKFMLDCFVQYQIKQILQFVLNINGSPRHFEASLTSYKFVQK